MRAPTRPHFPPHKEPVALSLRLPPGLQPPLRFPCARGDGPWEQDCVELQSSHHRLKLGCLPFFPSPPSCRRFLNARAGRCPASPLVFSTATDLRVMVSFISPLPRQREGLGVPCATALGACPRPHGAATQPDVLPGSGGSQGAPTPRGQGVEGGPRGQDQSQCHPLAD